MNAILLDLKNLQEVDTQARLHRKALDEGAAQLARAAAGLKNLTAEAAARQRELEALGRRHRELEAEVADLSLKKKNNENRQMSVKTQGEYDALLKEAGFLAARIDELEDEILALLDQIEIKEAEAGGLARAVSAETENYEQLAAAAEQSRAERLAQLAGLESRRRSLAAALPPDRLKQYETIAQSRAGLAVTAAAEGLCLACRLSFPPQIYNELQRNEKIMTCPNCGRLIYWRDHPDFKVPEAVPCPAA
ncbi:MAG: C4-type zinc ribbon domain-containing protein [Candidatus Adiutrix sp.]|jgi:predicted  nucleic acid-binding Zn-ribbon protein|nr:C4-type zinc ribbon domain-containing protein [Candidatus Adiutrix sp.]